MKQFSDLNNTKRIDGPTTSPLLMGRCDGFERPRIQLDACPKIYFAPRLYLAEHGWDVMAVCTFTCTAPELVSSARQHPLEKVILPFKQNTIVWCQWNRIEAEIWMVFWLGWWFGNNPIRTLNKSLPKRQKPAILLDVIGGSTSQILTQNIFERHSDSLLRSAMNLISMSLHSHRA